MSTGPRGKPPDAVDEPPDDRAPVLLEREVERILRFPDENPNPVMRIDATGVLLYANPVAAPILDAIDAVVGAPLADDVLRRVRAAAAASESIEVEAGLRTFAVRAVDVPELGFINLYGTDITAARVVERFPRDNPNPVFRIDDAGTLLYANAASRPLVESFGAREGQPVPADVAEWIVAAADGRAAADREFRSGGLTYALRPVRIPEFGFINVYGTDVTARRAMDKFPDENPNPVMRLSQEGVLVYANPASAPILGAHGLAVGQPVPGELLGEVRQRVAAASRETIELACDGRLFALLVVAVEEFNATNLYGRDITAERALEEAHHQNEVLLLNVLPEPIAARLRAGERVIADRLEDVSLLFADIVGFTVMSSRMEADAVVELLNRVFSEFDELVDRHGLEKVKTIGDAYMVVGGLPGQPGDHVARVAEMALELEARAGALRMPGSAELAFRVGMHVGPVIAGVIGRKKFIYDVWGDTVNTASRMESHSVPGRIQVTAAVHERLGARYTFESRGLVEIRSKGLMPTWFLVGRAEGARGPGEDLAHPRTLAT